MIKIEGIIDTVIFITLIMVMQSVMYHVLASLSQ